MEGTNPRLTSETMRGETTAERAGGPRVRARMVLCALLLSGAALLGPSLDSAQARPALGVAALDFPTASGYQRLARAGAGVCKISIFWGKVQGTANSAPNWASYDAVFNAAASAGIRVLPLLHGSAPWVNSNFERPPLGASWKVAAWQNFVRQFATRYGHNGMFWKLHPTLPYLPPDYYEVWNEPDLNYFWGGKPQPGKYVRLLKVTGSALKAADPAALVSVGGLFEHARQGFGTPASIYLNQLYRHGGAPYFDAVGLHPYAGKPRGVVANVKRARRVMRKHHDPATPILVTEIGWTVGGLGWARSPFRAKPGQQANRLSTVFNLLGSRPGLGIAMILWYSYQDGPENLWIYRMGLFDRAGDARPAWTAFARAAGGTP